MTSIPASTAPLDRIFRGQGLLALSVFAYFCGNDRMRTALHQRSHPHEGKRAQLGTEQIARALATSPTEARLRFDPQSPAADGRWPYDF
jgi:hypothetical protein